MKIILCFLICVISNTAFAQISEKWFTAALARSDSLSIVISQAQSAKIRLEQLKSDPYAIKPALLEASTSLEIAEARVIAARLDVRRSVLQDAFLWTNTGRAVEIAIARLNVANVNAKAANARFKTGAITSAELDRAEADLGSSQTELLNAKAEFMAATEVLRDRLGFIPDENTSVLLTPRPEKQILEKNIENSVRIIEARSGVARAKLDLEIKDNEFTAPIEITEAKRVLTNAERNLADARNTIKTTLVTRWEAFQTAMNIIAARDRTVTLAKDELKTQSERFNRGLVSQLVVLQAKVNLAQQIAGLVEAQQRFALLVLELGSLVNFDPWI
jgi:outer membrane protein TolC